MCAEAHIDKPLGYGPYSFEVKKPVFIDKNIILGLFTYEDDSNEIDIEFGRWGWWFNLNFQYVIQPSNIWKVNRFLSLSEEMHVSFNWQKDRIDFNSTVWPFSPNWTYKRKEFHGMSKKKDCISIYGYLGKTNQSMMKK